MRSLLFEAAVSQISDAEGALLSEVRRSPAGVVISARGLDKTSDTLFDLARSHHFMALAEGALGIAAMPLQVDYWSPDNGREAFRQDVALYRDHFSYRLLSIAVRVDSLSKAHLVVEVERSEDAHRAIPVQPGDCVGLLGSTRYRWRADPHAMAGRLSILLFRYRESPIRQTLPSL